MSYQEWADDAVIDILIQVYGDAAVLNADGQARNFSFLTGTLPELNSPVGGSLPVEAKNQKWNWVLFRIPNPPRPSDGTRYVGSISSNAQGDSQFGGVNGGTIRVQNVPGLIIRLVAFGEKGAFGEPEQINVFATAEKCDPEPETNLVFIDINKGMTNHLIVLNNADQTVTFADNVGPAGDRRRAVRPNGAYLDFGIADNYLGLPCNDPRAMKICVEFYDDPALKGAVFGPEAYATDAAGSTGTYPADRRHKLEGSGLWVRRSFTLSAVNLKGVNTASLTGGPRLVFEQGSVLVSSVDMAVLRVGNHPLAGQDPLADCFEDPKVCTSAYGDYAELDLAKGIRNGLAPGTSGGDQQTIMAEAGPPDDRRLAIRPAFNDGSPGAANIYMNFAITDEALGPSSQPNAHLAACVTYYDDPALAGATFRPEVYQKDRGDQLILTFAPSSLTVTLDGSGQWRDAYIEIPDIKFNGVNQGPQAAARFRFTGKVFFSRVRYAVIRPCGPNAGVNLLESSKPPPERVLNLTEPLPDLFSPKAGFQRTNHIVSTSVFQWLTAEGGQQSGPWRPLGGRPKWTGEPEFWKQQIKQMMAANIDVLYVHLIPSFEEQRINLFKALNEMRREGCDVPKVAPFLDPVVTWYGQTLNLAVATVRQEFINQYVRFFNQYFSVNQDRYADDYLAKIGGRIVLDTWHVRDNFINVPSLSRTEVETTVKNAFGERHPVFTNGIHMITTVSEPVFDFADEKVPQFEITAYYAPATYLGLTAVQLKAGYWDQNIRKPGIFFARQGGRPYADAWARVDRTKVNRVYIESWNEVDEGSGIYAAIARAAPYIAPGSGYTNTDVWSLTFDPYEYIKTTAAGASRYNDNASNDAIVLWHNLPNKMMAGETRTATVIVRNEGNNKWSGNGGYFFGQETNQSPVLFGSARYPLDDAADEIPTYGGIFRGRPKAFKLTLTAPQQPGTYVTQWQMRQQDIGGFGQTATVEIAVETPPKIEKPVITMEPQSRAVVGGASATFTVTATGTAPLSYQWRKSGVNIPGATSSIYTINSVQPADAGFFSVVVSNATGSIVSDVATLSFINPPIITSQLQNRTVPAGSTVTLTVLATGTAPFSYEWRRNGVPVPGATNAVFTLSNAQRVDSGSYTVAVGNAAGSATSNVATLTVLDPPVITVQPRSQSVVAGSTASLTVSATGSPPLGYQWQFNGAPIAGATKESYALDKAEPSQAGNYSVRVTNAAASITSATAILTVVVIPGGRTFTNGSFELPGGVVPNTFAGLPVGSSGLLGWTIGGPSGIAYHNGKKFPELDFYAADGQYHVIFNGGGQPAGTWIAQTFDTTVGEDYVINFNVGRLGGGTGIASLTAIVISQAGDLLAKVTAVPPSHGYGPTQTLIFRAKVQETTLVVLDTSTGSIGDVDIALDNVRVMVAPGQLKFDLNRLRFGAISGLRLKVNSSSAGPLRIEASTNLIGWSPLISFPTVPDSFEFVDSSATNYLHRFYRAVRP